MMTISKREETKCISQCHDLNHPVMSPRPLPSLLHLVPDSRRPVLRITSRRVGKCQAFLRTIGMKNDEKYQKTGIQNIAAGSLDNREAKDMECHGGDCASPFILPLGPSMLGIGFRFAFAVLIRGTPWMTRGSFISVGSSLAGTSEVFLSQRGCALWNVVKRKLTPCDDGSVVSGKSTTWRVRGG